MISVIIISALVLLLTTICWGVFDIRLGFFIKTYCQGENNTDKKIALTFDDGPTLNTLSVLKTLENHKVTATFFCIGKQIELYPNIFLEIVNRGHRVGNHTYSHSNKIGFWRTSKIKKEMILTENIIFKYSGLRTRWFRPPFGITNPHIAKAITHLGYNSIGWNIRSLDTVINNEERLYKRIKKRIKSGAIILMHDTSDKSVRVLNRLLLFLQKENYKIVALDELLKIKPYEK